MKLTSIPSHYRQLRDYETIRKGDYYYCILDHLYKIYRVTHTRNGSVGCNPLQWLDYRFFRRRHITTKQSPTRIALNESIAHWDRLANGTSELNETTGTINCALCQIFFKPNYTGNYCADCPISNFTGYPHCAETPYISMADYKLSKNDPHFKARAAKFRDWLKKLPLEDENQ